MIKFLLQHLFQLRSTKTIVSICFLLAASAHSSFSQIVITPNLTAAELINRLTGSGITYTNPTLTCPNNASGKFDNGLASSVLVDSGIVLTTGRALSNGANYGVNGNGGNFASINNNTNGGDANLATAAGTTASNLHDLCKLEFDFVPTGDTIQFRYRFGSEEYPQYNCSDYNDIFAFFISGPGYATPTNMALVPGTNIPVSINSINNGTVNTAAGGQASNCSSLGAGSPFTSYYVNTSASTTITYNGLTALLTAKAAVTPCSTYHMKFAIADLTDHIYDSGVFLEAGSFSSDIASVVSVSSSNTIASANPFAIEGCTPAVITIARPSPKPFAQVVTYTLGGSAVNGVDIAALSGSVTIPANNTSVTLTINALQDGITEGVETLILYINGSLCSSAITETLTIDIQEYPNYTIPNDDTICLGQSISLSVVPNPANPNLQFSWSPASSLSSASGSSVIAIPSATTNYTLSSSYPGCGSIDSIFTITVDPLPTLSLSSSNVTCNGLYNGIITANGTVNISPLSFIISPSGALGSSSPFQFSNLSPGLYTVTISSGSGCTISSTKLISQPNPLIWSIPMLTNPLCEGSNNGAINVTVSGGSGTINYSLLPLGTANTTGNFTNLNANSYTILAVDANGCSTSTSVNLTSASAIVWSITNTNNVSPCFGNANGNITTIATGGSGGFSYTLNPGGMINTSGNFNALIPGLYTVLASDANGCTKTTSLSITQPNQLQFVSLNTTPVQCNGGNTGSIQIVCSGGTGTIQYTLQPGSTLSSSGNFSNLTAGNYTIIASDANGCTYQTNTNINQTSMLQFTMSNTSNVNCFGGNDGSIQCLVSGGTGSIQYQLQPGSISNSTGNFPSLQAGNYTIIATDANACSVSTTLQIQQPLAISLSTPLVTDVNCFGTASGSIQVTANGGTGTFIYQLMPGNILTSNGNYNNLLAGNYSITATDVLGCTQSLVVIVSQAQPLQIATLAISNPACTNISNGSIQILASGGTPNYQYAINSSSFGVNSSFTNLSTGSFFLQIQDALGCLHDTVVQLTPMYEVQFNNILLTNILCKGSSSGSINLQAYGGTNPYSYTLNGINTGLISNYNNLFAGLYTIQVSDSVGCLADTSLTLSEPALALSFNSLTSIPVFCFGNTTGFINAFGLGGTSPYLFSMNGGSLQSSGSFGNLSAGNYLILIKDANDCEYDTMISVIQPLSPLQLTTKNTKPITCVGLNDAEIYISVTGGTKPYLFKLNGVVTGSDSTFLNLSPGNYTIEVTDSNGCISNQIINISIPTNQPFIVIENIIENHCKGDLMGSIDWTASNGATPYAYTFNGVFVDTLSIMQNLVTGMYTIEMTDLNGCKADTSIYIKTSTTLQSSFLVTPASCAGEGNDGSAIAVVTGGFAPYEYSWIGFIGSNDTMHQITYGEHLLIIKDAENCLDTNRYVIEYIPCCEVSMPNAFSPNGDGKNDVFRVIHYGLIQIKSFEIFDRWGNNIFHTTQDDDGWDGKFQNVDSEIGTYYYLLTYYCQFNNKLMIKKGDITLVR
ncbi:MAG: choice-of-anchor L domain-containing protein [Bacteroidetes bacterium]|nr:choice-of-anchor L domain-containing protein [Bacteroidota bacterium]